MYLDAGEEIGKLKKEKVCEDAIYELTFFSICRISIWNLGVFP